MDLCHFREDKCQQNFIDNSQLPKKGGSLLDETIVFELLGISFGLNTFLAILATVAIITELCV